MTDGGSGRLLGLAALVLALYGPAAACLEGPADLTWWLPLTALAGVAWLVALFAAGEGRKPGPLLLFAVAFALRAPLYLQGPALSTDPARYLFEGAVLRAGASPWVLAPRSPELAAVPSPWRGAVAHPEVPAAYGPLALLALAGIEPWGLGGLRLLVLGADLLAVLLAIAAVSAAGRGPGLAIGYAWCPLVAFELARELHLDALVAPLVLAGLVALLAGAEAWAGAWLGLSLLVKPAALLVVAWLALGRSRRAAGVALVVLGLGWLPVLAQGGSRALAGMGTYLAHWQALGLLADPCFWATGRKAPALVLGLVLAAALTYRLRASCPPAAFAALLFAPVLLGPVAHPWYLVPGLGLVPFLPWPGLAFLAVTLPFAHAAGRVVTAGTLPYGPELWAMVWLPVLLAGVFAGAGEPER